MRRGHVIQDGSIDDFRRAPVNDFVREFLAAHRDLPGAAA
jgi:ABC-type proline/glycine betaine transport system ATPase subunit